MSENLYDMQQRIENITHQYGRAAHSVKLLAVSKSQSIEKIKQMFASGQRLFGENYLQEAIQKQNQLQNLLIEWHFIGQIQSNKTKLIAEHFTWVHTISDIHIAERLNKHRPSNLPPLNCCIQINISQEITKGGVLPEDLPKLVKQIMSLPNLHWRGLMAIPALTNDAGLQRQTYAKMRKIYDSLRADHPSLDTLSMGMSNDWEAAVAEGATLVRIGTALFGKRH